MEDLDGKLKDVARRLVQNRKYRAADAQASRHHLRFQKCTLYDSIAACAQSTPSFTKHAHFQHVFLTSDKFRQHLTETYPRMKISNQKIESAVCEPRLGGLW